MTEATVYDGAQWLGTVRETDEGQWEARTADGYVLGAYPTRVEAAAQVVAVQHKGKAVRQ